MNSEAAINVLFSINESKSASGYATSMLHELISHEDEGVREEAALILGVRLKLNEMLPDFLCRLDGEEKSNSVLPVLIDAIVLLLQASPSERGCVLQLLARLVLDVEEGGEVRGAAYLGILRILEKITPREFAVAPSDISEMNVDMALVSSLVGIRGMRVRP